MPCQDPFPKSWGSIKNRRWLLDWDRPNLCLLCPELSLYLDIYLTSAMCKRERVSSSFVELNETESLLPTLLSMLVFISLQVPNSCMFAALGISLMFLLLHFWNQTFPELFFISGSMAFSQIQKYSCSLWSKFHGFFPHFLHSYTLLFKVFEHNLKLARFHRCCLIIGITKPFGR